MENLQDVANFLNKKYSSISDFKVNIDGQKIKGGFYKMNYMPSLGSAADYYFHETFCYINNEIDSYDKLFEFANSRIQKQLKWQKNTDESFVIEFGCELKYQFDYSTIED